MLCNDKKKSISNEWLLLKVTGIYKKADAWLEHQMEQLTHIHQHMGEGIQEWTK